MRASLVFLAIVLLPGCSFRGGGPGEGRVETLTVSPWSVGGPTFIRAKASFPGAREGVTLALEPDAAGNTIKVRVYGTVPQPPLGLGVFNALPNPPRTYDVQGAVNLPRAGSWRVEALSGAEVTATASFAVE